MVRPNTYSYLEKAPPLTSAVYILALADSLARPHLANSSFLSFNRRDLRRANRWEYDFEVEIGKAWKSGLLDIPKKFKKHNTTHINSSGVITGSLGGPKSLSTHPPAPNHLPSPSLPTTIHITDTPPPKRHKPSHPSRPISGILIDLWAMYSNFPVHPFHRRDNCVCVYNPSITPPRWQSFIAFSALFGSVHSAITAIRLGEALQSVIVALYGIAFKHYIDDLNTWCPREIVTEVQEAKEEFLKGIGLPFKDSSRPDTKVQSGTVVKILGLIFDVQGDIPFFYIEAERRKELREMLQQCIDQWWMCAKTAETILGKLTFCLHSVCGRRFNSYMRPLMERTQSHETSLTEVLFHTCQTLIKILSKQINRKIIWEDELRQILMYTDASFNPADTTGELSVFLFVENQLHIARTAVKAEWITQESRAHAI